MNRIYPKTRPRLIPNAWLPLLLCCAWNGYALEGGAYRVLLVGDSWSEFMWVDGSLRAVFALWGHPDLLEKGDVTAISGSTAAEWARPGMLQLITDELDANPTIDLVQLTIGGNDFLAGMPGGGWYAGIPQAEKNALLNRVVADVETVIDHILALDPAIEIVLSFYDYTNFVESLSGPLGFFCTGVWNDLNQPAPFEINSAQLEIHAFLATLSASRARVAIVDHYGLMQFEFGYPSMGIPPATLIPPGDLSLPSPPEAMRFFGADCFHLGAAGHQALAQNLWDQFYRHHFCVAPATFLGELPAWPAPSDLRVLSSMVDRFCD